MARSNWEADKMLDVYIYDYLMKRNLHATAKAFMTEGKVAPDPVAIDAPGGFLFEWWSIFWDVYDARSKGKLPEAATTSIDMKTQRQLQLHQQSNALLQPRDTNRSGAMNTLNRDTVLGPTAASVLSPRMMEDQMRNPNLMDTEGSTQITEANRMALLRSQGNQPGPLVPGTAMNMSALQQMQSWNQQTDIKGDLVMPQRTLPTDPSAMYGPGIMQAKPGLVSAGLNQGVGGVPLKGWPLTGANLGGQKQLVSPQNQFQILSVRQHHMGQPQSMGSPAQCGSPKVRPDDADYLMKIPQSYSNQRLADMQPQHQLQQGSRKRKPTSSGAANSTGTGNTVGPSPPSTLSTHTPGDGIPVPNNTNIVQNSSTIYGPDGTCGLASSSNQMDNLDNFPEFDDNVESFLSNDDGDGRDIFAALKQTSTEQSSQSLKRLSLTECASHPSNNKVVCCHFSSDGNLLASAGHDKKVVLWNMETEKMESKNDEHSNFITDIRFMPNSTQLATSSSDGTVRLWSANERSGSLQTFNGHSSHVTSVDFHPKRTQLLCSSDVNGEMCFWTVGQNKPSHIFRGGTGKVRFQPRMGQRLAAAAEKVVNIIDAEKASMISSLQGHNSEVLSICWDENGEYLASLSQDIVKVWSLTSRECIHDLRSNGNQFQSCIFHPTYPKVLVVGGYQSLELWSMADNQRASILAHEGLVAALSSSYVNGYIASASHDRTVKLWK